MFIWVLVMLIATNDSIDYKITPFGGTEEASRAKCFLAISKLEEKIPDMNGIYCLRVPVATDRT